MKKSVYSFLFLFVFTFVQGQNPDKAVSTTTDTTSIGWKKKGNVSLLFNQSNFNNWIAGGENNLSGNIGVNYDFNYKKKDWAWDNKVVASYGLLKTKNASFEKKTDDRFEFNSVLGKKAYKNWYYSFFLNFRTQFTKGYIYGKDDFGKEIRSESTNLFSPGYLTFGPGMLWKKSPNLKFNLAPLTSKITFVDKEFTLPNEAYFGVKQGETLRYELGFYASAYYKLNIITNVSAENTLNIYSNYLEETQNIDLDYSLAIVMRINRYLSTNIAFQAIYDDNAFQGFQTREVFGLGVNFAF